MDFGHAVFGGSVEVAEVDVLLLQPLTQNVEHGDELAEDQDAVPSVDGLVHELEEEIHFGGGLLGIEVG